MRITKLPLILSSLFCILLPAISHATSSSSAPIIYFYAPHTACIDLGQMNAMIYINNKKAFVIGESKPVRFQLKPGTYAFRASSDNSMMCDDQLFPGTRYAPVVLNAKAGHKYTFYYGAGPKNSDRCISACERHIVLIK